MALNVPRAPGLPSMIKDGARYLQGLEEAVYSNIEACVELGETTRSTFGPSGMNKMVINHIGKLFVTNDAAVILRELEVAHPAAKMMVLAAQQQEQEGGDGTNLVIMLCAALLNSASDLLKMGLSVTEVADGYELASKKAMDILKTLVVDELKDFRNEAEVARIIKPVVMSKQFGNHAALSQLIAKACISTMPEKEHFNVDNVRVCKILGSGVANSTVLQGMVFRREAEGDVHEVQDCKVVVYSCPVDSLQTETKGTIRITTAKELTDFSRGEENLMEEHILDIVKAGCKLVISGGKVGELALHYANKHGLMMIRLNSKFDIRRLCNAIGATPLPRLTAPTAEECGHVSTARIEEIGGTTVVVFRQKQGEGSVATIVLRGSTDNILDNAESAVDDGVNTYKCLTKNAKLVPGAGATEMEIAKQLGAIADKAPGLEQYAMRKYATSFEVVARALAENYGLKATEIISQLYAAHQQGRVNDGLVITGDTAQVLDAKEAGILDLYLVKYWGIKFATTAACTILRIDKIIMAKPAGGPKPKEKEDWDD